MRSGMPGDADYRGHVGGGEALLRAHALRDGHSGVTMRTTGAPSLRTSSFASSSSAAKSTEPVLRGATARTRWPAEERIAYVFGDDAAFGDDGAFRG